eukprot:SAG25_NODE_10249_length_341_cov_0.851240_1_plen_44_part_10
MWEALALRRTEGLRVGARDPAHRLLSGARRWGADGLRYSARVDF